MSRLILTTLLCLTTFTLAQAEEPAKAAAPRGQGIFEGPLKAGAIELRLGFHLKQKEDGNWSGTMDSVDQGVRNIPLSKIKIEGDDVSFAFVAGGAKFAGKLSADGQTLTGTWEQGGSKFPLTMKKVEKALVLVRPQEPKKPYPYLEEDVSYENPKAKGVKLAGTLTLPKGEGPFPALILISGSGPQNRNEELLGHKPFWVLADYYTRQGIAVLRFDDRGVGKSTGNHGKATSADFATDVEAGIDYLKTRKEINGKKIGLMGHSEGGLIAPMVAAERPADVAFIVLLAGPGLPGDEILRLQSNLIAKKAGSSESALKKQRLFLDRAMIIVKGEPDDAKLKDKLKEMIDAYLKELTPAEREEMLKELRKDQKDKSDEELEKLARTQIEAQVKTMSSPWMRYFLAFDPRPTLAKVKCPVLAINGELDLQVPIEENLTAIEQAVKSGGNADVNCVRCKSLNHLFQHTKTGLPSEYGSIEETFCTKTMENVGEWIKSKVKSARKSESLNPA